MVTVDEVKTYLRMDDSDEDLLIQSLIATAEKLCQDMSRLDDESFENESSRVRVAILYAVAYLFEHREEADHKELNLTLRALLFGVREVKF